MTKIARMKAKHSCDDSERNSRNIINNLNVSQMSMCYHHQSYFVKKKNGRKFLKWNIKLFFKFILIT